ncbi:AraC family transcriptional regulator [uncultured Algibacter sp.]|uniref:AraC family transcriptional regulator n=1 Tax=uncultured Algibacter sp. TaxID=298659 RepID=UPI00260E5633|nr:AraC family transcriptional regulator [uncultured Algibacter sp.]
MSFKNKKVHREITPLIAQDSFLVLDRVKTFYEFPIHFHPEFELNFISNGKGIKRIVGDSVEEIEDLELVLVGPNLYHGWKHHKCTSNEMHEITVQFSEDLFHDKFLQKTIMKPLRDMFNKSNRGILFSKAASEAMYPRLCKVAKLDGIDLYLEMVSILYDLANSKNQELLSSLTLHIDSFQNSERIKIINDFIHQNYDSKITLEQVSVLVNMSSVSFNRFIKSRTGKTFIEYLNDVRIGYASRFLVEKDLSISEIAFTCGFNTLTNFNRQFKKQKGCTPTAYKENFNGLKRVI